MNHFSRWSWWHLHITWIGSGITRSCIYYWLQKRVGNVVVRGKNEGPSILGWEEVLRRDRHLRHMHTMNQLLCNLPVNVVHLFLLQTFLFYISSHHTHSLHQHIQYQFILHKQYITFNHFLHQHNNHHFILHKHHCTPNHSLHQHIRHKFISHKNHSTVIIPCTNTTIIHLYFTSTTTHAIILCTNTFSNAIYRMTATHHIILHASYANCTEASGIGRASSHHPSGRDHIVTRGSSRWWLYRFRLKCN